MIPNLYIQNGRFNQTSTKTWLFEGSSAFRSQFLQGHSSLFLHLLILLDGTKPQQAINVTTLSEGSGFGTEPGV